MDTALAFLLSVEGSRGLGEAHVKAWGVREGARQEVAGHCRKPSLCQVPVGPLLALLTEARAVWACSFSYHFNFLTSFRR